ncbi:MAG TPA: hypothetical protein VFV73_25655 [Streptosporangiaceae bacterium]|nr:hypothetical protein [Streptosporangiaceae bacterium]
MTRSRKPEAYPLNHYSMYGAVPLTEIKRQLLALRRAGKLDRVKMLLLTNCTFDGIVYDVNRVMEECLAIRPKIGPVDAADDETLM